MQQRPARQRLSPQRLGLAALAGMTLLAQAADASVVIEVRDGLLVSATVSEASIETAVEALGAALGAEVVVRGELGPAKRQRFADVPFEAALRRLVDGNGFMVRYQPSEARDGPELPREIRVFARRTAVADSVAEQGAASAPRSPEAILTLATALIEKGDGLAMSRFGQLYDDARDPVLRRQLVASLSQQRLPAAGAVLERALTDSEKPIRILAARGLWASRGFESGATIRDAVRRERDPAVRQAMAQLLKLVERERPY